MKVKGDETGGYSALLRLRRAMQARGGERDVRELLKDTVLPITTGAG